MSNIFNHQLEQALTKVNDALLQQELSQTNKVKAAKLGLYYAHGVTSKNQDNLKENQAKSASASKEYHVSSIASTHVQNIVTAANANLLDASNTTSKASAAADSIQKAATAITNLSGNTATTMAIATSFDRGSKIQRLVDKANRATKRAAKLAEEASLIALNLTVEASQARAADVVKQSGEVKTNMTNIDKALFTNSSKIQDLVTQNIADVKSSVIIENDQSGAYKTASVENEALTKSGHFLNKNINYNLTCTVGVKNKPTSAGDQFSVSFNTFPEKEDNVQIISEYRIILVKQDDSSTFNTELAKATAPPNFTTIKPNGSKNYKQDFVTPDFININGAKALPTGTAIARDYDGNPIVRGVPYTFFVYVVYTSEYQNNYNDTNGMLTLPSPVFTLLTPLPTVDSKEIAMAFFQKNAADAVNIVFKVPSSQMMEGSEIDLNDLMEFRSIIFNDKDREAFSINQQIDTATTLLFSLEKTYRLKEQSYQQLEQSYNSLIAQGASDAEIAQAKNELEVARIHFQEAKSSYNKQLNAVSLLNQQKINNFFVDEEILSETPAAYYLTAKKDQNLVNELKAQIDKMNATKTDYEKQQSSNDSKLASLNKSIEKLSSDMDKILNKENPLQENIKKSENTIKELLAKLELLLEDKADISSVDDAKSFQKKLKKEQSEENDLLNQIIQEYTNLGSMESQEVNYLEQLTKLRNEQKKVNTELVVLNAQQQIVNDELQHLPKAIQSLTALAQVEDTAGKITYDYYIAKNESGDFTDNYGHPLITGDSYSVVVLSTIKDSEPEAAPLYQGQISGFSAPVVFDLEQL